MEGVGGNDVDAVMMMHRALWALTFGLSWITASVAIMALFTGNPRLHRGWKFLGAGAITVAFLASWL